MPLSVCNDSCLRRPSFIKFKQNGLGVAQGRFWAIGSGWIMTYCSWPRDDRCLLNDPKPQTHPLLLWVVNRMSCLSIASWCLWPQRQPGSLNGCVTEKRRERKGRGTEFPQRNEGTPLCLFGLTFPLLLFCPFPFSLAPFAWCNLRAQGQTTLSWAPRGLRILPIGKYWGSLK